MFTSNLIVAISIHNTMHYASVFLQLDVVHNNEKRRVPGIACIAPPFPELDVAREGALQLSPHSFLVFEHSLP